MKRTVYIGTEEAQELAARVLQHTIEAHSGDTVQVRYLNRSLAESGLQVDNAINSNTPFSKQRVFVPLLAGEGQAAYIDSDMMVFQDINALFDAAGDAPIASCPTRQAVRDPQTSVTVFNVQACRWDAAAVVAEIDQDPAKYRPYLYEFSFAGGTARILPAAWNDLEYFDPGSTCLLHFTDMDTQPWATSTNRLADIWLDGLRATVAVDLSVLAEIDAAVARGHVRPSLHWQARHGWPLSSAIPFWQRLKDVFTYVPPHTLVHGLPFGWGRGASRYLQAGEHPAWAKRLLVLACSMLLLARRRRRLLVVATLLNRTCIINRSVSAMHSWPSGLSSALSSSR